MLDLKISAADPRELSPITLAFIGDAVYELLVRERMLKNGSMPAHKLHSLCVKKVCATSQASAFSALEAALNDEEASILKRGRNSSTSRVPKSCSPGEYRKATAIEALFGYLYLKGDVTRLCELFELMGARTAEET